MPASGVKRPRLPDARRLRKTLREHFGHTELRPGQEAVIANVLEGRDTLAIMPTGAGKSLCYQLPALYLPGTTLVVSPLIALMKDQADKLGEAGIDAAQMNSTLTEHDEQAELRRIARARREIVFATPERLADPEFMEAMRRNAIDLFVIDEAHCISQWGHDFRPAFLTIADALDALGNPPLLALTATATQAVIDDIRNQLNRPALHIVNTGVYRPNLHYRVCHVTNEGEKLAHIRRMLTEHGGSSIIYCATIKGAEAVYQALEASGESIARYHGRLTARERREQQDAFMSGARRVMVATNAFGLGVDKPDIRSIIHYQVSGSIEAYYQEAGRAGRDGEPALCALLYDVADRRVQQFFLGGRYPDADLLKQLAGILRTHGENGATLETLRAALPRLAVNKVRVALKLLRDVGAVQTRSGQHYALTATGFGETQAGRVAAVYRERGERDREKLERMIFYAQTTFCRWKVMLEYFGEGADFDRCEACDNCVRPPADRYAAGEKKPQPIRIKRRRGREFATGAPVAVPRYGIGRVVGSAGEQVEVEFPDGARRTFLSGYVAVAPAG